MHGKQAEEKRVRVDTTVRPKNITYPTDSKLYYGIINRPHKIVRTIQIVPRRSYVRGLKESRLKLWFLNNPKAKTAKRALRQLKTITGALLRDVEKKLPEGFREGLAEDFGFYRKVLNQKKSDKDRFTPCMKGKFHASPRAKPGRSTNTVRSAAWCSA